ncbi:MAG: hypothetical protein ABI743_13740, partial [bacterium]
MRYGWQSLSGWPDSAGAADPAAAATFLASVWSPEGFRAGVDLRKGPLPATPETTACVIRALLKRPNPGGPAECGALLSPAATLLAQQAPKLEHPQVVGAALWAVLELAEADRAGGRWTPTIKGLASQLVHTQDSPGTWTTKAGYVPACAAAIDAGAALHFAAIALGGDPKIERAASQCAEWTLSKQKTNGYFYACTWSNIASTNPLLSDLVITATQLLRLGLALDNKHYRAAGLLTLRNLVQRLPEKGLPWAAWTSEWNYEKHRSPYGALLLAQACQLALQAPGPERHGADFAAARTELLRRVARCQLRQTDRQLAPLRGGVIGAIPLWGREAPWRVDTAATA